MNQIEIIPAFLVNSSIEFERHLRLVENSVMTVQVDILDGSMFNATSWFDAVAINALNTRVQFELHLMVENPMPIIDIWAKHVPNTVRAIIHAELDRPLGTLIELIHQNAKLEAGVALNPETPFDEIHHVAHQLDEILIMGVHPGASGQGLGDSTCGISAEAILEKIERIHDRYPDIIIGVDGGVNPTTIAELVRRGSTRLNVNNAIFSSTNPLATLRQLQSVL